MDPEQPEIEHKEAHRAAFQQAALCDGFNSSDFRHGRQATRLAEAASKWRV